MIVAVGATEGGMNTTSTISLPLLAVLAVAAVAILWWALRGWRQPVPPSCQGCGYDVSGRPAESTRCSECGADLSADGAVVTVVRRRRRTWAVVAGVVLAMATGVGFVGGRRLPWRAWYIGHAPAWVIHRRARADLWPGGDAYRGEWYRREGASPALIDHLLDVQANVAGPFAASWDGALFAAYDRPGTMTDAQRQRYVRQTFAPTLKLSARNPVRAGDPLHLMADTPSRGTFGGQTRYRLWTEFAARADGPAGEIEGYLGTTGPVMPMDDADVPNQQWTGGRPLPPGVHRLGVLVRRTMVDDQWHPVTQPVDVRGELTVHVLPADAPLGTPVYDASAASAVGAGAHVFAYDMGRQFDWGRVKVSVCPVPVGVDRAYRVCAVIDGREVTIGTEALKAGQRYVGGYTFDVPLSRDQANRLRKLTVVLVGDGEALRLTPDQQWYWAGRVVYPKLPLESRVRYSSGKRDAIGPTTQPFRVEPARPPG